MVARLLSLLIVSDGFNLKRNVEEVWVFVEKLSFIIDSSQISMKKEKIFEISYSEQTWSKEQTMFLNTYCSWLK